MSNWKKSYGWSGHILVDADQNESNANANVIAVPYLTFERLNHDYANLKLDPRIRIERLGVIESDTIFLACGTGFSEGFECYGAPFLEAELRVSGHIPEFNCDALYIAAMKEIYGIELPPCRLMVGCSSEH